MKNTERVLAVGLSLGVVAAIGYFLYIKYVQGEDISVSDLTDVVSSLFARGYYAVTGRTERVLASLGQNADARTIALGMIAEFESFSPTAYPDPPGQTDKYSIGYGHQIVDGDGFTTDSTITESDARALLNTNLDTYVDCVNNAVTYQTLTPNQYAALYSFTYNEGCGAFEGSTLLSLINSGDLNGASAEFPKWNIAGGQVNSDLVSRRADEQSLFNTGISS